MKEQPKDIQTFMCLYCGHTWKLICQDRYITDNEFIEWITEAKKEHDKVCDK